MSINPYNWEAQGEVLFPNGKLMAGLMYIKVDDDYIAWDGSVTVEVTSSGSAIEDGVDSNIKATVIDGIGGTGVANPLAVSLYDDEGNPISGIGGGPVTIADGADVVEGELADAAVVGDNTGTVSAKLRGINKILADVWDSVNNRLNVFVENATLAVTQSGSWVLSAGAAIIGAVTINRTTPGTTNTVAPITGQDGVAAGAGAVDALTQRTTLASDDPAVVSLQILDDWDESDRAKVNPIAGQAGVQGGSGTVNALTQRVVLATDVALPTGTNAIGTVKAQGTVADDNDTPGDPVMSGGFSKSPDGTDPGNVSAEGDAYRSIGDLNRRQYVNTEHPNWWSYHYDGSSARTDDEVKADPGDGFQIVITEICFSSGTAAAINIFLEEGSTKILGPWYLEAVAGRGVVWRGKKHVTPSTAVTVTTSAANAQSIDIQGYVQKV